MLERRFPRSIDSLEALFAWVREFLAAEGLDESRAFTLDLVAEELFTNRVKHARGGRDLALTLARAGDVVELTVRDPGGTPFDPMQAPAAGLDGPLEERRAGGMGLHLVRALVSELRYHRDGGDDVLTALVRPED